MSQPNNADLIRLDRQVKQLRENYPGALASLRISGDTFGMCTQVAWMSHGWLDVTDAQAKAIMDGGEVKKKALLEVLGQCGIKDVEFVPGINVLELVPYQG